MVCKHCNQEFKDNQRLMEHEYSCALPKGSLYEEEYPND